MAAKFNGTSRKWERVVELLNSTYDQPDIEGARVVYSAMAAHRLPGQPVWLLVIGPSGSGKSESLNTLDGLPGVHMIDQVTKRTFISGLVDNEDAGLLPRIGPEGVLIVPDFSTILELNRDERGSILADLRKIYDGRLTKEFGTGQSRSWTGRITLLAACTEAIDRQQTVFQSLGERFVRLRLPRPDGIRAGLSAMAQGLDRAKPLREAVHSLLDSLPRENPELPETIRHSLASLGDLVARGRTEITRSSYGNKEIIDVPQPEGATRVTQQLAQIARGSALLGGRTVVDGADLQVARRVALDSLPRARRRVLDGFIAGSSSLAPALPASTKLYAQEELAALGLLDSSRNALRHGYRLSELARRLLVDAGFNLE